MKRRRQRVSLLNIKVTAKDKRALNAAAQKYVRGNLSAWLRLAGMHYRPGKQALIA